jgi:hypothetical protein
VHNASPAPSNLSPLLVSHPSDELCSAVEVPSASEAERRSVTEDWDCAAEL